MYQEVDKQEHKEFIQTIEELEREFKNEGATISLVIQTNQALLNWLIQHISKVDREFAGFVRSRSESPPAKPEALKES